MTVVEQKRGFVPFGFVAEAAALMFRRPMLVPAALLLVVLTASSIVLLLNVPPPGSTPRAAFIAAAFVRIAGLLFLSSVVIRLGAPTDRSPWRLDGGFWLYALGLLVAITIVGSLDLLLGATDPLGMAMRSVIGTLILAPFGTWMVGMNVARPLGWRPRPFMRDFRRWLPPLIFWTLLLLTPTGVLHAVISLRLIAGVDDAFWPLAVFDGALSTGIALTGLALNLAAYRRVARP